MKKRILIVGSLPPPVGGVTIHVKRLLDYLEKDRYNFLFLDLKKTNIWILCKATFKSRLVHLHTSNVYLKFIFSLFCFFCRKKILITYHGNLNRYTGIKNTVDKLSIIFCSIPIVINLNSLQVSLTLNKKTRMLSAFIPPLDIEELHSSIKKEVVLLKQNTVSLFCTNAYNVSFDKEGKEIYRISDLVNIFSEFPDKGLIVSDPSGSYLKFIRENDYYTGNNILFIPSIHDFNAIIRECDCMIRFTTTDGDSLSIKEALLARVPVIASDVVNRPVQVITVKGIDDLNKKIELFQPHTLDGFKENGYYDLLELYNSI